MKSTMTDAELSAAISREAAKWDTLEQAGKWYDSARKEWHDAQHIVQAEQRAREIDRIVQEEMARPA
tara:strand:- start:192 stop:392 length:201 start_codon:yes stop_codon:yes gene_type:complete